MTDTEINIAIAEACGWEYSMGVGWWHELVTGNNGNHPNYCADLNAMHEAEKTLTLETALSYAEELHAVEDEKPKCAADGYFWHIPARQRAEAFLKTIGKWVDSHEPVTA